MSTALETYEALRGSLAVDGETLPEEAFREARFLLSRIQHQVLSSQHDGFRRQMYGILFAHAMHVFDLEKVYDEPRVWVGTEEEADPRRRVRGIALAASVILFLLCAVQLFFIRELLLLVGFVLCALLLIAYAWRPRKRRPDIRLTRRVNPERLQALLESSVRAIDRDMEAIGLLLPGEGVGAVSDDVLELVAKVLEIDRAGVQPLPDDLRSAVEALLVRQAITLVDYTGGNGPLFQTLPTQRQTRTLVPAMLRDEHLIRAGLAIVAQEEA